MIVFDLRCDMGHVFEAWFASGAAFDDQQRRKLLSCAICGSGDVTKALMAPSVARSHAGADKAVAGAPPHPDVRALLGALAAAQAKMLETSQWVGSGFAQRARAMHAGEEAMAPIHGRATLDQARTLLDDGVPVAPLLVPVVPPDERH